MKERSEINRLIETVGAAKQVLQPEAMAEVRQFISQSQLPDGRFTDRGNRADWYYTFFGYLLCKAFDMKPELNALEQSVLNTGEQNRRNLVDWAVWVLLRQAFRPSFFFKLKTSLKLGYFWVQGRHQSDRVYLTFLSLLILNHFWGWARCISGQVNWLTSAFVLNDHSPVSHLAAAQLIRHQAGLETEMLSQRLLHHAHPHGGFVAFENHASPDLLSTAVAVYALSRSGNFPKERTADGLDFISEQFESGAFIAGDGDPTRDLEYTFYGLLGLSAYAQSLTKSDLLE
jgi:hypothetical protein